MRGFWRFGILIAALVGGAGLIGPACAIAPADFGSDCPPGTTPRCCPCPWPEACPEGPKPIPWDCANACDGPEPLPPKCSDAGDDAGDAGMSGLCAGGVCVPSPPDGWKAVAFVSSWGVEPPACPADAPIVAFEGAAAPPPPKCGTCSCAEPDGVCTLPEKWTVSSGACANPGVGVNTNFDPPVGWDGSCAEDKAIPAGLTCNGVPCVRSITIAPPVIKEEPCKPVTIGGEPEDPLPRVWNGGPDTPIGLACVSDKPAPPCSGQAGTCTPGGPAFSACIMSDGDLACPTGWGDRHLLFGKIEDFRECSACTCGEPSGGTCEVLASVWRSQGCSQVAVSGSIFAGMIPPCLDLMSGIPLAGKAAEIVNYTKGSCPPIGGEIQGDLILDNPATICCFAPVM